MKKNILSTLMIMVSLTALTVVSCKKNNFVIDKDPLTPAFVKFKRASATDTIVTYYIKSTNVPLKLPIALTNVSGQNRTIQFSYTSKSAVQGVQYNAPATLVIPAGKSIDSLSINGLFSGFTSSTRVDTLDIVITGGDVPLAGYNTKMRVYLRKFCDVVLANMAGNYANTNEYTSAGAFSYGPYTTSVKNLVSTGAFSATGQISNLYDDGWPDLNATFDFPDPPGVFKVTIPLQATGKTYGGVAAYVRTSTAAGAINTFSSCDNTISIAIDLTNAAGTPISTSSSYNNYRFILRR